MKAQPIKRINQEWVQCLVKEATHIKMIFPIDPLDHPALRIRYLPVQLSGSREDTGNWSWNGDTEKPTVKPSILTQFQWGEDRVTVRCHTFVNDGMVEFLQDCSHEFAGHTLHLLEVIQ